MLWKGSKQFGNLLSINFQIHKASSNDRPLHAIGEGEMINDVVIFLLKLWSWTQIWPQTIMRESGARISPRVPFYRTERDSFSEK